MALTLGSVSVAADGIVTKSGECATLYDLLIADVETATIEAGAAMPTGPASAGIKRNMARLATTMATYCHGLLTARATVKISTTDSGLQRMPASTVEDTACKAPSTDKFLPIV